MCGLLGYSGEIDYDPLKIKMLFLYNEQRGSDSCGIYTEPKNGEGTVVKKVGKASTLLVNGVLEPSDFIIGHTRKSTVGSTSEPNAHPFKYSMVVGAHNGGITNYTMLANSREIPGQDYWVDSQALYRCMNKDKDYTKVLEDYAGGAALLFTMFNNPLIGSPTESHKLYAYHDKEKPLFHGRIKISGKIGTYISSTKESLEAIGCTKIREFPINVVHIFEKGRLMSTEKIKRNPMVYRYVSQEPDEDISTSCEQPTTPALYGGRESESSKSTYYWHGNRNGTHSERPLTPNYILYAGYEIRPNSLGKSIAAFYPKHIKKAKVMYAEVRSKTMTIRIMELADDASDRYKIGQLFQDVRMEYFETIPKLIPLFKEKNSADVKIEEKDGLIPALNLVEKNLQCSDFDNVRDQYWATLISIREKLDKMKEDGPFQMDIHVDDIKEFLEEEIFTMFTINV